MKPQTSKKKNHTSKKKNASTQKKNQTKQPTTPKKIGHRTTKVIRKQLTKHTRKHPIRRFFQGFLFTIVAAFSLYVLYLDQVVTNLFGDNRWSLPARVFAHPLEIYPERPLSPDQFEAELIRVRYRKVDQPNYPGSYMRKRNDFLLFTRNFSFWDGTEPARKIKIAFTEHQITTIHNLSAGQKIDLFRLDPMKIGSIYPRHLQDRILVDLKNIPKELIACLIAVEDRGFYKHRGINLKAILRAMWANLRAGAVVQGGSTLTQQLVKNFFLTTKRNFFRKINEAIMALLLERHYTKKDILQAYLNEIYLGQDGNRAIHGIGLASQFYFDRPISELKLSQMALLVALIRGPSYYEPRRNPERALERRNRIIDLMHEFDLITPQKARIAKAEPLGLTSTPHREITSYPAFMDLVKRQLKRDYRQQDLTSTGMRIFTSLDPIIMDAAEQAIKPTLRRLEKRKNLNVGKLETAIVVTDTETGEVLAIVGGKRVNYSGFNRALDALRPIGSLIKPAVYLTALQTPKKYTLITRLNDKPLQLKNHDGTIWSPKNYDHRYHGSVPLYKALAHSYNIPTVRLGQELGLPAVTRTLAHLGIQRPIKPYPALLLGALSLSPLEIAQMYQTLASGGFFSPLRSIRAILDNKGKPVQRYPLTVAQKNDAAAVFLVNTALQEAASMGTARSMYKRLPKQLAAAGKTGTTDDLRDSWFAGFLGNVMAVVWIGRDDNNSIGFSGAEGALQLWTEMMLKINTRPLKLMQPDNVEMAWINMHNLKRSRKECANVKQIPFIMGTAPSPKPAGCK